MAAVTGPVTEHEAALQAPLVEAVRGVFFCSNPDCVLHVRSGDRGVAGAGEWAVRPDGVVTSRRLVDGQMVCDVCGRSVG